MFFLKRHLKMDIMGTFQVSKGDKSYTLKISGIGQYQLADEKGNHYDFPAGMIFILFDTWVNGQKPQFCEHSGIKLEKVKQIETL